MWYSQFLFEITIALQRICSRVPYKNTKYLCGQGDIEDFANHLHFPASWVEGWATSASFQPFPTVTYQPGTSRKYCGTGTWYFTGTMVNQIFENFIHGTIKRNTSHHQIEPSPTPISQILCLAFLGNNCKELLPVPQDFPSRMPPLTFTHSRHQPSGKM